MDLIRIDIKDEPWFPFLMPFTQDLLTSGVYRFQVSATELRVEIWVKPYQGDMKALHLFSRFCWDIGEAMQQVNGFKSINVVMPLRSNAVLKRPLWTFTSLLPYQRSRLEACLSIRLKRSHFPRKGKSLRRPKRQASVRELFVPRST